MSTDTVEEKKVAPPKGVEIEWRDFGLRLCEGVSSGMELAWANKANQQCTPFVHCKDYLQDAVQCHLLKEKRSVFGFTYDPENHPTLSMDRTRILIGNPLDPDFSSKVPNIVDFMNSFEKRLRLVKSTAVQVTNPINQHKRCGCWLIRSSARWMAASPMVSLYALLLRVGPNHPIGEDALDTIAKMRDGKLSTPRNGDGNYLKSAQAGIERILKYGHRAVFYKEHVRNFDKSIPIGSMHGLGIIGFTSKSCAAQVPHWYREIKESA